MKPSPPREYSPGEFVFFHAANGDVESGIVISAHANDLVVHFADQAPKLKAKFTPLYTHEDGSIHRHRKAPAQTTPVLCSISPLDVIVSGTITSTGHIPQHLLDYLGSVGVVMPAKRVSILTWDDARLARFILNSHHIDCFGSLSTLRQRIATDILWRHSTTVTRQDLIHLALECEDAISSGRALRSPLQFQSPGASSSGALRTVHTPPGSMSIGAHMRLTVYKQT